MDSTKVNGYDKSDDEEKPPETKNSLLSIVKCEFCAFWCSDPRYIKLHREVDHFVDEDPNKLDDLSDHRAAKKFKEEQDLNHVPRVQKNNVEEMIRITHTLLSHLYSILLDTNGDVTLNEASQILERVVPQNTPTVTSLSIADQAQQAARLLANFNLQHQPVKVLTTATTPFNSASSNTKSVSPERDGSVFSLDSNRKRKREDDFEPNTMEEHDASNQSNTIFDIQSLIAKNNLRGVLGGNSNGSTALTETQLLIERIRAAQIAHQKRLENGEINSEDEADAIVNPQEPREDNDKSDDDIEIIHMADEPEVINFEESRSDTLAFPSSDTLSRNNLLNSRNILSQIQKNKSFNSTYRVSGTSPVRVKGEPKYESPKSGKPYPSEVSAYSLVAFTNNQTVSTQIPKTPISCSICGSHWRTPSALNIHMRVHTGEKPYKCYVCGKGHKQKGQLKVHINKHHPGRWSWGQVYCKDQKKCSMCGEVYSDPKDLSKHILECVPNGLPVPPGQAKPNCEICGLQFTTTLSYQKHMETHKLEKSPESPAANFSAQLNTSSPPPTRISDFNSNQNSSVNVVAETLLQRLKTNPALLQYSRPVVFPTNNIDLQKLAANLAAGANSTRNTSSDSVSNSSNNSETGVESKIEVIIDKSQMAA